MSLNIVGTQYTLSSKALEIFIGGCNANPHCQGCHNPELWSFDTGTPYDEMRKTVNDKLASFSHLIDKVWVTGGDPIDQDVDSLIELLDDIKSHKLELWIFTRHKLEDIPKQVLERCNYIKCGRYLPEKKVENHYEYGVLLATSNQHILKRGVDY